AGPESRHAQGDGDGQNQGQEVPVGIGHGLGQGGRPVAVIEQQQGHGIYQLELWPCRIDPPASNQAAAEDAQQRRQGHAGQQEGTGATRRQPAQLAGVLAGGQPGGGAEGQGRRQRTEQGGQ